MSGIQLTGRLLLLLILSWLLTACGVVLTTADHPEAFDEDLEAGAMLQNGVASWYGEKFHGRTTANGETYDMYDYTAAHRTLPFNTLVRVTNQENGKSVDVRINDRGPYVDNRIIDLSKRAAEAIDMYSSGIAEVELFLLGEGDRPITEQNLSNIETFTLQLASFSAREQAENFARGIEGARIEEVDLGNEQVYRVFYGTFTDRQEADQRLREFRQNGFDGFVKQLEN